MRGPELWLLDGERQPRAVAEAALYIIGLMTNNYRGGSRRNRGCGIEDVLYQRPPSDFMEDFGLSRLHSGALPGGQDDDVGLGGAHNWLFTRSLCFFDN